MDGENSSLGPKSIEFIKKNSIVLLLILIGLGSISYGTLEYLKPAKSSIEFVSSEDVEGVLTSVSPQKSLTIDIQGEVENPGVYEFIEGSRISDAVEKAGGFNSNANSDYIAKNLNQAQKLVDGQKIYIPSNDEEITNFASSSDFSASVNSTGLTGINSASKSKLEELPRIGPVTADKIINGRPYSSIEELKAKKIVGQSVFEEIKPLIDLN